MGDVDLLANRLSTMNDEPLPGALSVRARVFIIGSSFLVWLVAFFIVTPAVVRITQPIVATMARGPGLLFMHALVFSLPTALLCGGWLVVLVRHGLVPAPAIHVRWLRAGLTGAAIAVATVPLSPLLGLTLRLHVDWWSVAGNAFSNGYEEIIYRGLIFAACWAATSRRIVASVLSGVVFGLSHYQYPLILRAYVAVVGVVLALAMGPRREIGTAYVAHDIADWILDSLY